MKKLSVIIPTRNRASVLKRTLDSIAKQTLSAQDFEVIVVDNGSTDNTKEVAGQFKGELDMTYVFEPKPGLHEGRHTGLKSATSDILVYADDDIEAFPEWLSTVFEVFKKDEKVALVGGKNLPNFEIPPPFWILEMWNKITNEGEHILGDLSIVDLGNQEKLISPFLVFGCNFSVRKQVVINAGGFHPDGMPFELIKYRGDGETYISSYIQEQGLKTYYHPLASVKHLVSKDRMCEEYFCKRRYIQGISDAYTQLRCMNSQPANKLEATGKGLKKKPMIKQILMLKKLLRNISNIERIIIESRKTDFEKKLENSYKNGYEYLINCYNSDLEIQEWVHKQTYL